MACRRYYDGLCAGAGPCDICKHDPDNELADLRVKEIGYRLIILALLMVIVMAAVLA